ncbi:uncharacterized protein LOC128242603 [Mya arenaria]|uniref:uncharacterized protein LOC128242603 n=1 Tax=Mya arenaria TaxID=6604 RepID=UPI0022E97E39|nr:uncharacterized protein LOC128242603 [Mya arenaria]
MGIETKFRASHVATKAGAVVLLVTVILYVVGFATNGWAHFKTGLIEQGLWKECLCLRGLSEQKTCVCTNLNDDDALQVPGWYKAVRACAVIALLFLIGSIGFTLTSLLISSKPSIRLANIACAIFAGIFIVVALIVFRVKLFEGMGKDLYDLKYSYNLCTTVVVFIFVILTPLLIVGHMKTQSNPAAVGIAQQGFVIRTSGHTAPGQPGMAYPMTSYPTAYVQTGAIHSMHSHPVGYVPQGVAYPISSYPAGYGP